MSWAQRDAEGGWTLVELLVVLLLVGVVGGVVTSSSIAAMRATRQSQERTYALTDIQRGLERVGRELRAAAPLELDPSGVYSDGIVANIVRDGEEISFRYYLSDEVDGSVSLLEDVERRDMATGTVSTQNGLFIADIANRETGTPLFRYFRTHPVSGLLEEVDCDELDESACAQQHGTATQVQLTLEKTLPEQDPISVQTVVNIRNTRLG
jgi:type II secretory pathway pseudopilin PulG